jgi:hypothetical protein
MPLFRLQPHGMEGVEAREAGKNGSGKSGGSRSWPCGSRWRMKRAPAVVAPRPLVAAIPLQLPGAVSHGWWRRRAREFGFVESALLPAFRDRQLLCFSADERFTMGEWRLYRAC